MSGLDAVLERREKDTELVVGEVKRIILDTLKSETLRKLRKGEYAYRAIYDVGSGKTQLGFAYTLLVDYIRKQDPRFNLSDIRSAFVELKEKKEVGSISPDLGSAHDLEPKYKEICFLFAKKRK